MPHSGAASAYGCRNAWKGRRSWRVNDKEVLQMYAIIATGGKQYRVEEGDIIRVEKLELSENDSYTFDQVLALNDGSLKLGNPTVEGATVTATSLGNGRAKKVVVYRYKSKKGYHKKNGHRQAYTEVRIDKINA